MPVKGTVTAVTILFPPSELLLGLATTSIIWHQLQIVMRRESLRLKAKQTSFTLG